MNGDLLDALAGVRVAHADLAKKASARQPPPAVAFARLVKTIETIGSDKLSRPLHCPDEYRSQW